MARMGPIPTPNALKILRGNSNHKSKAALSRIEPSPTAYVTPPEPLPFLSETAKAEWHRITPELCKLKILTILDTPMLAAYCQAYGRYIEAEENLADLKIIQSAAQFMQKLALEFGCTPAARSRLSIKPSDTPPVSKFEDLLSQ